jgi:hypothetical protein
MSDEGAAFYAMQPRERHGRLIGIGTVSRTFLRGPDGKVLSGKQETDTESMEVNLPHGRRGMPASASASNAMTGSGPIACVRACRWASPSP